MKRAAYQLLGKDLTLLLQLLSLGRERPSVAIFPKSSLTVTGGEVVQLNCIITAGLPVPTISWLKDGLPLNDRVKDHGNGSLAIGPVTNEDAGMYTCVAENAVGSDRAHTWMNVLGKIIKIGFCA